MTPNQINALAREYAEEYTRKEYPNVPGHVRERIIEGRLEHMEDFIPWLLRHYCLVEKSKLETEWERCRRLLNNAMTNPEKYPTTIARMGGRLALLETLFPEFFKDKEQ